jgi:hypothetical protein
LDPPRPPLLFPPDIDEIAAQTPQVMSQSRLSRNHCEPHWPHVFHVAQSVPPGG